MFEIKRHYSVHACALNVHNRDRHHASFKVTRQKICHKYDDASSLYRPSDIRKDFQEQFWYEISYHKAYKERDYAIEKVRSMPYSFTLHLSYIVIFEKKNLDTRTFFEVLNANNFKYFFMAVGSCIHGFISLIMPFIAIGGNFLRENLKEIYSLW